MLSSQIGRTRVITGEHYSPVSYYSPAVYPRDRLRQPYPRKQPWRGGGMLDTGFTAPGRLRIADLPFDLHFTCTGRLWIFDAFSAPGRLQIVSNTVAAPTNVLAVHIGQGAVLLDWQEAARELVDHYDVQVALSAAGPWYNYPLGRTKNTRAVLYNLPLNLSIYLRVRAVGKNLTQSDWTQAKRGKRSENFEVSLLVRGIQGTEIVAGASFQDVDEFTNQIVSMTCKERLLLS